MSSVVIETNLPSSNISVFGVVDDGVYGRLEFLQEKPHIAIPTIVIISLASIAGTFGNILILMAVATYKKLKNIESVFIVNLAICDMFVTAIADPMNIVAKLEGEIFFISLPGLCQTIASLCTVFCIGSLMSIGTVSFNRYIYICHQHWYSKLFTKRSCVSLCISFYILGVFVIVLNVAGLGGHQFDRKAVFCTWDRMATHNFTIILSILFVWVPMILIGACYYLIYRFVSSHRKNISSSNRRNDTTQLAKTLFIIYAVFTTCWIPYALAIAADINDSFSHETHSYVATFAHLHPSINWIVYYTTNKNFRTAFNNVLGICRDSTNNITGDFQVSATVSQGESSNTSTTKL
ncbi:hypothetical protein CHS0354_029878 [Potamilus streckersoni]|uniref:G-protein coupled receptors family 1 profile domain-containing protein n=1 Tax=Potamilus streckersoni TaxID=2493646 RepID=A0AAE0WC34_9BIVA|nr:hypothetical protein CHS0354_029878 [Potamilus streckersoni]